MQANLEVFCLTCERAVLLSAYRYACPDCGGDHLRPIVERDLRENLINRLMDEARGFVEEGDFEPAVDLLDRVLSLDPTLREAMTLKAQALEGMGDLEIALTCYQALVEMTDGDLDALTDLGFAQFRAGMAREALATFDRIHKMQPRNKRALAGRAWALVELGRDAEALAELNAALNVDCENGDLWVLKGMILEQQGRHANALRCYETALEHLPEGERREAEDGRDRCLKAAARR